MKKNKNLIKKTAVCCLVSMMSVCTMPFAYAQEQQQNKTLTTISENIAMLHSEAEKTQQKVLAEFEMAISNHIQRVEKALSPQPGRVETLNMIIESDRHDIVATTTALFSNPVAVSPEALEVLSQEISEAITRINTQIKVETGISADSTSYKETIKSLLEDFSKNTQLQQDVLVDYHADLIFKDTDNDGISDYQEVNLYGTDPLNSHTASSRLSDGEKVVQGINPQTDGQVITYQDVRTHGLSAPKVFTDIAVSMEKDSDQQAYIAFTGTTLPNTLVTVYVFSTQVTGTVKADEKGNWVYHLKQGLADGLHTVYVAAVDSDGSVIVKSDPVSIQKTAQSVTLTAIGLDDGSVEDRLALLKKNSIPLVGGVIIIAAGFIFYLRRLMHSPL